MVKTLVSRIRKAIGSIHIRRCTTFKRSFTKVNLFIPTYDLDLKYYLGVMGCGMSEVPWITAGTLHGIVCPCNISSVAASYDATGTYNICIRR